jgi:SNF2 family DNA or RNA helicase
METDGMDSLWSHQTDAIAWAEERNAILLHHEMGCGKTRTAIEILKRRIKRHGGVGFRTLVACPKAVIAAWVKQLGLWWPDVRVVPLTKGTSGEKAKQVEAALADRTPVVFVVNYETAWRMPILEKTPWSAIVWDEVHRLKSPSGAASRWASRVCKKNAESPKIGLSGTLIPHSVLDCYGVWRAVESPECQTFGTTYTLHKARYAVIAAGQNFIVGYKNLEDAHRRVAATTHRAVAADVLDLPQIQFIDLPCDLTPPEAKVYVELEKEFCAVVEQGTVTPANALVQLLRMQQSCGGSITYDGDKVAKPLCADPAKSAVLADMLEDSAADEPWVIFCRFRSDISAARRVCENLKRSCGELSGSANDLAAWQAGETGVLITQVQSGGIGIDLTRGRYCCFYSLGYSLSEYLQAVARLHRPGQQRKVSIWHLVATIDGRSTVDGRVYQALRERKEVLSDIIDGYERRAGSSVGAR